MHDMLKKIVAVKEQEVATLKSDADLLIAKAATKNPKDFKKVLSRDGLTFISEIKRKSPSKGNMAEIKDPEVLLEDYVAGGADAISVLTDEEFFAGSIADCELVALKLQDSDVCVLRKDFIIDSVQVYQTVAMGADILLLIVAVLGSRTKELLDLAKKLNIASIVEVHTEEELLHAIDIGAEIIGINNRNLDTFEVDINNCLQLIKLIPDNILAIAESAIHSVEDIKLVTKAGFAGVLIGEALVKAQDPRQRLMEFKSASC